MCRQDVSFQLREKYYSRLWKTLNQGSQSMKEQNELQSCVLSSWFENFLCLVRDSLDFHVRDKRQILLCISRQIFLVFVSSSKLPHFQWQDWRHQSVSFHFFWQTKKKCDREIQEKTVRKEKQRHSSSFPTQASCFAKCFALLFSLLSQKCLLYLYLFINLCLSLNALRCMMNIMVVDSTNF